ncbi:hypothetical protein BDZ89DRAFT_539 [Hymenopellis radicata]|nr:hypothetical protein BDZ89DRAFT_539 [Hymenopellis radicata]
MDPLPQQQEQPSTSSTPFQISEQSQEQRAKIIEIISGTANGCLNELGYYPQLINDLKQQNQALLHQVNHLRSVGEQTISTLQKTIKDVELRNNNLFQDNRNLSLNNTILVQDNERLKKENLAKQECIDNLQRGMMNSGSLMDQYQKACVALQQLTEKHSNLLVQYNMLANHPSTHGPSSSQSGPPRHPDRRQSMPSAMVNRQSLEHPPQSVAQPLVNVSRHGQSQRQQQPAHYVPSHNPQLNSQQIPPHLRPQQSQPHPPQTRAQQYPLNVLPQPPHFQPLRSQQQTHPQHPRAPNASQTAPPPALRISTQSQSEQNMHVTQQMPPTPPMSSMSERPAFLQTPASLVHSPIVQSPHPPPPFSAPPEHPQATPVQPPTPPVSHKSMSPEASQETKPVIDNQGNVVTESSTAQKKRPSMSMEDVTSNEANKRPKIEEVEDAPMPVDTPSSDEDCIEVGPDGRRPIYNCILDVLEEVEDGESDVQKLICLLCRARHLKISAPEPTPFVDPTPEELEAHFMSLHAIVIEKMRDRC